MGHKIFSPRVPHFSLTSLVALAAAATPLLCIALAPHPQSATASNAAAAIAPPPLPQGPGKVILEHSCAGCHSLAVVTTKRATPEQWSVLVRLMVSRGAPVSDQDMPTLTQYLAKSFSPDAPQYALPAEPLSAPTTNAASATESSDAAIPPPSSSTIHVNVNRAGVRELISVLSLTRDEAETLIAYRRQHGDFQNWQQVGEIPGVPAGKIIQYQNRITF